MYFALVWVLMTNGVASFHLQPMPSLEQCRALASVMRMYRDDSVPDIKCVAMIFDREDLEE